jgi:ADP-dependent NAD(P)H-hydrate dehydratase / NAD(P)H-hydrate epimerase
VIPVLTRAQMRAFDEHAIVACKVPSLVLMENAGRGATDVLVREALSGSAEGRRAVCVAGPGNNGGDGFVVARHLLARGAEVVVFLAGDPARMTPDCRANHDAFVGVGGSVEQLSADAMTTFAEALSSADVAVDALFGTGLDRAIDEPLAGVVRALDEAPCRKVALDVPSGMNADTGGVLGVAARADLTVTFAHPKLGHLTGQGARLSGELHVVDIGVPPALLTARSAEVVESRDVRALVAPRPVDLHKYRAGHVAILAGSPGRLGASLLAARGALRGGAGAATIVTWPEAATALESRVVEIMTARIPDQGPIEGSLDAALAGKRAVVVGPGFGTDERARAAVGHLLSSFAGPIVLDADALTMHAGALEAFRAAAGRAILTPHAGELARLLSVTSEEIEADRFAAVREAAARARAVVVLKGPHSLVASSEGRVVVSATGNPALATAGSGDVLAGLCGALSCTLAPFEAAYAAVYLHGAAGDAWSATNCDRGLLASEIADALPGIFAALTARS